jgi:hypothetical protein
MLIGCASFVVARLLVVVLRYARGGRGAEGCPTFIRPAAYWSASALGDATSSGSARHIPPQGSASTSEAPENIVLAEMRVSWARNSDDPRLRIKPQLGVLAKDMIDFDAAASGANCSAASNLHFLTAPHVSRGAGPPETG